MERKMHSPLHVNSVCRKNIHLKLFASGKNGGSGAAQIEREREREKQKKTKKET